MPINFIPNDPVAQTSLPMRQKAPRPNRPASRAGFNFTGAVSEGVFAPGTPGFLFWQCREAALLSVEIWESLAGNLTRWARSVNRRKLDLLQTGGEPLNAGYNGQSLEFSETQIGSRLFASGASTDVVTHEAGHGFLDAIRPDLWDSTLTETNAFHEAFGDCIALLVAFSDKATRDALLAASPNLGSANFVESTSEDLANGVRLFAGPNHPAAAPRHALNNFRFQLPTTLPTDGPPRVLTSEVHSFGRVFSGCFYDAISNIFAAFPVKNEATLATAAQTAGRLLVAGARQAPETPRFFQAVGRAMVLADQTGNGGANRQAITAAFARHNIALGSNVMLAPRAALVGSAPKLASKSKRAILAASTSKDLKERMGAPQGARLAVNAVTIGGETVAQAVHYRDVPLGTLSDKLKGVVAVVAEPVLVGRSGTRAAVLSALPDANTTTDEVYTFVETLLKHGDLAVDGGSRRSAVASRKALAAQPASDSGKLPTHVVRARGGKKVIERVRFKCCCKCQGSE